MKGADGQDQREISGSARRNWPLDGAKEKWVVVVEMRGWEETREFKEQQESLHARSVAVVVVSLA